MSLLKCFLLTKSFKSIRFPKVKNIPIINSVKFLHCSQRHFDSNLKIKMPSLSPTMTEGTIVKWLKKEGDTISAGDTLCEIQTDKAVVGFETEEEGILHKILIPEETKNVKLGEVIAEMIIEGEVVSDLTEKSEKIDPSTITVETNVKSPKSTDNDQEPKLCGPSVRNMLHEYSIKYSLITATGPQNNLLKGDVLKYIKIHKLKPKETETKQPQVSSTPDITFMEKHAFFDIPHTSTRQLIAKQLLESKRKIPHAYMSIDSNVNNVLQYIDSVKVDGVDLTLNDFLIKSVAHSLEIVNEMNVDSNNQAKFLESIDVSFTVAIKKGFVAPIIKNANLLGLQEISQQVRILTQKAIEEKLEPHDFEGRSFSISNLGVYGISEFSAILSYPQVAMMAVGMPKLVFLHSDQPPVNRMTVTLSFNTQIIDEASAAKFLQSFKQHLENPSTGVI